MELNIWTIFVLSAATVTLVAGEKVPVVLWNINGAALQIQPVAIFDEEPADARIDSLQRKVKDQSAKAVAFVVDQLSMEDLAGTCETEESTSRPALKALEPFLDKHPHMLYPSVEDPIKQLQKLNCGLKDIYAAEESETSLQKIIASALEKSCVVIVHLSDSSIATSDLFVSSAKANKDVIGIFTAVRPSWVAPESKSRKVRSLLTAAGDEDDHFFNSTCLIMYVGNITVKIGKIGNDTRQVDFPASSYETFCENRTGIQLTFDNVKDVNKVVILMDFKENAGSWSASKFSVTLSGGSHQGEIDLSCKNVEAPVGFSFSCGDLMLKPRNSSYEISLKLERFQVQGYITNREQFSSSFDCVPFFTLPIWMGIFVGLLFIVILNTGIYALFNIKTMDRFDDPKGKTISVPL